MDELAGQPRDRRTKHTKICVGALPPYAHQLHVKMRPFGKADTRTFEVHNGQSTEQRAHPHKSGVSQSLTRFEDLNYAGSYSVIRLRTLLGRDAASLSVLPGAVHLMSARDIGSEATHTSITAQHSAGMDANVPIQSNRPAERGGRLLEQARSGSLESQGELLERCRSYLLLVAARSTDPALRQKVAPSDLVQETFLNARRCFSQFQGSTEEELQNWLRRILENNARQTTRAFYATTRRDLRREISIDAAMDQAGTVQLPATDETPSRQIMAGEQTAAMSAALARLPQLQRLVIVWRKVDGKAFSEIGKLTNRSEEAARKVWIRAIDQLRLELARAS